MAGSGVDVADPQTRIYCSNHPKIETLIRCSKCLIPICTKCAVRTPVGLRCAQCARVGRSPLYAVEPQHYAIGAVVGFAVSLLAGAVMPQAGLFFTLFLAVPVGGLIAEAVVRSIHGKRGRPVQIIAAVCIPLGALLGPWLWVAITAGSFASLPRNPLAYLASLMNINSLLYSVLAVGAAVARLR